MRKYFVLCTLLGCVLNTQAQTYQQWVEKSVEAVEKKDYQTAQTALKQALVQEPANPNNTLLLINLGTVQRYLKLYAEALNSYNAALAKYPDNVGMLHSRASLYCEMEKWNEALLDYNHILHTDKNNYQAYGQRAMLLVQQKKYSEAYADYAKLEELKPNLPDGLMGKALIAKMEQKWSEAEEIYTTLTYRYKNRGDLYAHRAECYLHLNKLARTQQDIEKAISLNYTDPYVYVLRGQLRLKQYDKGAAVKDFLQAKSLGYNPSVIDEYIRSAGKKP